MVDASGNDDAHGHHLIGSAAVWGSLALSLGALDYQISLRDRRAHRLGKEPDLITNEGVDREVVVSHDPVEDRLGHRAQLPDDPEAEAEILRVIYVTRGASRDPKDLALAADADVLANGHREGPREHLLSSGRRCRGAERRAGGA